MPEILAPLTAWWAARSLPVQVLLAVALTLTVLDLVLKRVAPESAAYAAVQHAIEALGAFWTAIILGIIYFVAVSLVHVGLRLSGTDPLDRSLAPAPSFWHPHEPNPLGPRAAARHLF